MYLETSGQSLAASYRYDAFGNLLNSSGSYATANTYRFSSKEWIPSVSGYYYLYRFYRPDLQRWLNRDPIGIVGGINLYSLVFNDPINIVDLFGLDTYEQNRQLGPKCLNHPAWPRSRYNFISHTFVFTTNPDGTLNHTYSWGTDANLHGWTEDYQPDKDAANQALQMGGNYLDKIGDSSMDQSIDDAYSDLSQNEAPHNNDILFNNCKTEARKLEERAKQFQQQHQH